MNTFTPEILQERLSMGLGNPGGARGSLTRLVGDAAKRGADETPNNTNSDADQLVYLELTKLYFRRQRLQQEAEEWKQKVDEQQTLQKQRNLDQTTRNEIEKVQSSLAQQWSLESCWFEYANLAKKCLTRPSVAVLRAQLNEAQQSCQSVQQQCQREQSIQTIRLQQYQHVISTLLNVQQSLQEDVVLMDHEKEALETKEEAEEGEEQEDDPMEEGEDLYGDL